MDFNEFNRQYKLSRARLIAGESTDLDEAQAELRQLADELTGNDQQIAHKLIDGLPALIASVQDEDAEHSPEMREAIRILDEDRLDVGTIDERLAALADARKRILAIADRAGADSLKIRGLTRGLDSTERALELGPPWSDPVPNDRSV
jgi:hypothetical protein